jgi:arginase family enzyme
MRTSAVFFPFELFGEGGTATGARALADALREQLRDNRQESRKVRPQAYAGRVRIRELDFSTLKSCIHWRERGRRAAAGAWDKSNFLLWVAAGHHGLAPVYEELASRHGNSLVVQLDGHLDIQNFSDSTETLSHGNFLSHCSPRPPVINVGHRDLLLPAAEVERFFTWTIPADQLAGDFARCLSELRSRVARADRVFIDLDWDVMDPAYFPAVTHPVPFGLMAQQLLQIIEACWSDRTVGLGMSEFAPACDRNDQSLGLAVWLMDWLMLKIHANQPPG